MTYAILIVVYSLIALAVWNRWVDKSNFDSDTKIFYLYFSIPFIPAIGLALAAITIYTLKI